MSLTQTPRQVPAPTRTQPPHGRPGPAGPPVAFWLLALVLTSTMVGTTLPTPLYATYQARWHLSAAMVSVTFAVYAAVVGVGVLSSFTGTFPPC